MVIEELDYNFFEGFKYSKRNRLCVLVHPNIPNVDLGQEIVDDWETHLDQTIANDNYCILLVNGLIDEEILEDKNVHMNRIQPLTDKLRSLPKDKYLEFKGDKEDIFELNNKNLELLQKTFKVKPILPISKTPSFKNAYFLTCEVDGLYRDMCVPEQKRYLEGVSVLPITFWKDIRYIDPPHIYDFK